MRKEQRILLSFLFKEQQNSAYYITVIKHLLEHESTVNVCINVYIKTGTSIENEFKEMFKTSGSK